MARAPSTGVLLVNAIQFKRAAVLSTCLAVAAIAQPSHATSLSLGRWEFKVDGGTLRAEIFTDDAALGATNNISAITGFFVEDGSSTPETATLLPVGVHFNVDAGGDPTDNLWLGGTTLTGPHLDLGGFAFGYGASPPLPSDQYQVYYDGGYKGCWNVKHCVPIQVNYLPEPGAWALMILGFGGVGGMLRRARRTAFPQLAGL
jgi:hypothetical protein